MKRFRDYWNQKDSIEFQDTSIKEQKIDNGSVSRDLSWRDQHESEIDQVMES